MFIGRINIVRILLATATLALLSVYGYYYAREWMAKWVFSHQSYFAADELILITVAHSDLTSETAYLLNESEFEWKGQMVDVLHREVRSDTVYVYGFRDEAETKLKQKAAWLYQDTAQPDQASRRTRTKRIKWRTTFDLPGYMVFSQLSSLDMADLRPFFCYSFLRITRPALDVLYPPPNQ
ncbi:hypothetical protein [Spirosoma flavum]|uniref:DUF4105 domain-containing protein n=1 Tax=Spirosoma flavum TaxID=2048557 RepID=A0ABW6ARD7_9BACT